MQYTYKYFKNVLEIFACVLSDQDYMVFDKVARRFTFLLYVYFSHQVTNWMTLTNNVFIVILQSHGVTLNLSHNFIDYN